MEIAEILRQKKVIAFIATALIAGILMLCVSATEKTPQPEPDVKIEIEQGLERILENVKGAGNVGVFVMFSDSGMKSYEKNIRESENAREATTVLSGSDNSPAIIRYSLPEIKGVIITAQGAENESVRQTLKEAAITALGVPSHRVCVLTGK